MSEMTGLTPTFDVNGGNNCNGDGWGNWGGALIGGAIGGAVGSGWWGGNRNSNGGGNCCCAGPGQFIMDSLTTMRSDVNSIGRDQLIQTTQLGQGLCQGFGGVNASVERVGASLAQGQCRTEAAVLTTGLNGQIQAKDNTIFNLNAAHASEVQGMRNAFELNRERLLRESAAKDAKIAQLEAQSFNTALAAGTAQQARNDLNAAMTNIIGHMAVISGRTTPTTAAAA